MSDSTTGADGLAGNGGPAPILVAYDASLDAQAALDWAIREARISDLPLLITFVRHDFVTRESSAATMSWSPAVVESLAPSGVEIVADGVARATAAGVVATSQILEGPTAAAIAEQSTEVAMIVIGSRGIGAIQGAFLGSVVPHVASHSHCPVIVVRAGGDPSAPVVVGVDGSAESLVTLGWAFEFADRHGLAVDVRYAYEIPIYPEIVPYIPPVELLTEVRASAERAVSDEAAQWSKRYPGVVVTTHAVQGHPARMLADASRQASLVVVGSHGRGGFTGMLLGSTSQTLLHHAHCTVAVIRHEKKHRRTEHRG